MAKQETKLFTLMWMCALCCVFSLLLGWGPAMYAGRALSEWLNTVLVGNFCMLTLCLYHLFGGKGAPVSRWFLCICTFVCGGSLCILGFCLLALA